MRTCRIKGCTEQHKRDMFCCRTHWYRLPQHFRNAIWDAYRNEGVFSKAYMQAAENAEAFLEDRNARNLPPAFA